MDFIKQRLGLLYLNIRLHQTSAVFVKGIIGLAVFGSVATPTTISLVSHHHQPTKPKAVTTQAVVPKTTVASKPKPPPVTTPAQTTSTQPAQPVASAPAPAPQPKPLPASSPSPGSGAKSLTPTSSTPPPASGGSSSSSSSPPPAATGGYSSTNWSGYLSTSGSFTTVSGSWTVPNASGTSGTADSTWIGIGGVISHDLIQTGTEDSFNPDGSVSTYPFFELLPAPASLIPGLNVHPGDSMSAAISETAASTWQINLTDNTTSQAYSTTLSYSSTNSSAEWIEEDPSFLNGSLVPFDNFGSVSFSSSQATANGIASNLASLNSQPVTLVDSSDKAIATPSILTGSGTGFTVSQD